MQDDQNRNRKGRSVWLPLAAIAAVIAVGVVGLTRGCSYAAEEPDYQNSANGVREAPDA